jgi:hypothetical protein
MLELKLRRSSRTQFQAFHADFMSRLYPEDYIRVSAHGGLGDGGMDGYLRSTNTVYQCYGADNGRSFNVASVTRKMIQDYNLALENNPDMKEWIFTHNLIDVPADVTKTIIQIENKATNDGIKVGIFGLQKFRDLLKNLSADDMDDLIGLRSLSAENAEQLPEVINEIIGRISEHYNNNIMSELPIRPVPLKKMEFNLIPIRWKNIFRTWVVYSSIVENILAEYPDESIPEFAPIYINQCYLDLKKQGLDAQQILDNLCEKLAGYVQNHDSRYEASLIVLTSMFESCVIFEDNDERENPEI